MSRYSIPEDMTDIVKYEVGIQASWQARNVFKRTLEKTKEGERFTFYDGPPFATGLPHYGHMLAASIKDAITRYQTMRGKFVQRRFGWDCHGVPIEHIVEKNAKATGQTFDRTTVAGRGEFNEQCRAGVIKYTSQWRITQNRIGRFIDMDNDFKTMDPDFMESVWWVFKQLHEKGLAYQGKTVVAYSPTLGTPLSDFEAKEAYQTIDDPQIVAQFELVDEPNTKLLVWTTTPWTMPTNVAIAINPDIQYAKITTITGEKYILSHAAIDRHFMADHIVHIETIKADTLIGKRYRPLFHTLSPDDSQNAYKVIPSNHVVDGGDGTALVHISPAFGEDDYRLSQENNLPVQDFFDENGCYREVPCYAPDETHEAFYETLSGQSFKAADRAIIDFMQKEQQLFSHGRYRHEYPMCYRSGQPLMYRAIACWFIAVTKIKQQMIENNRQINWAPKEVGQKRFHNWLENARDWNVSRNRYFGTPIPIWENVEDPSDRIVIGSREELRELSGQSLTDLHSHFVDPVIIEKEGKRYQRVPYVFDCWFESGSMPYAQAHYPFKHGSDFHGSRFPANFIAEGLDQTRGWFYTLLILSTALYNKPPFYNCMVNGILLGNDGKKMSKSKGNFPPLDNVLDKYGADAMRFVLLRSKATYAEPLAVTDNLFHGIVKDLLLPIQNLYKYFAQTANRLDIYIDTAFEAQLITPSNPMDQWLIWRTESFKEAVTNAFDQYNLIGVCREISAFVSDFSKWYVRNIKSSLQCVSDSSRQSLQCMHFALDTMSRCIAPVMPFISEYIYQMLHGADQSVHLADWPNALPQELMHTMRAPAEKIELVRELVSLIYSLREQNNLPLGKPLPCVYLDATHREQLAGFEPLICQAVKVSQIIWSQPDRHFDQSIQLNFKVLGPKLKNKADIDAVKLAIQNGEVILLNEGDKAVIAGHKLSLAAGDYMLTAKKKQTTENQVTLLEGDSKWAVLDTTPMTQQAGMWSSAPASSADATVPQNLSLT